MPGLWYIFLKYPLEVPKEHVIHSPGHVSTRSASKPATCHLSTTGSDFPFEGDECSQEEGIYLLTFHCVCWCCQFASSALQPWSLFPVLALFNRTTALFNPKVEWNCCSKEWNIFQQTLGSLASKHVCLTCFSLCDTIYLSLPHLPVCAHSETDIPFCYPLPLCSRLHPALLSQHLCPPPGIRAYFISPSLFRVIIHLSRVSIISSHGRYYPLSWKV